MTKRKKESIFILSVIIPIQGRPGRRRSSQKKRADQSVLQFQNPKRMASSQSSVLCHLQRVSHWYLHPGQMTWKRKSWQIQVMQHSLRSCCWSNGHCQRPKQRFPNFWILGEWFHWCHPRVNPDALGKSPRQLGPRNLHVSSWLWRLNTITLLQMVKCGLLGM